MTFLLTSVCRMAARCSLAVRDSLSTSICCLQSEFWLFRVSSFVCRANSSDSFFDNSCFSWSIYRHTTWNDKYSQSHKQHRVVSRCLCVCVTQKKSEKAFFSFMKRELLRTAFGLFSSIFSPLSLKMHLGLTPLHASYIIHHLYS